MRLIEAKAVFEILDKTYPEVKIALNFQNPLECWIAVLLSGQCTDKRVNTITPALFNKYKSISDYANCDIEDLKKLIFASGYYNAKSKKIIDGAKYFVNLGYTKTDLPNDFNLILGAPGIGKKTANVIFSQIYGTNVGIAIDTHNQRIARRLGLATGNVIEIENKMMTIFPKKDWRKISLLMVEHGRNICVARNPKCEICPINEFCKYYHENIASTK